jgi:hypothetical protein
VHEKDQRLRVRFIARCCVVGVGDLHVVDVEEPSADTIVPTHVLLIAVVAESQATALLLLCPRDKHLTERPSTVTVVMAALSGVGVGAGRARSSAGGPSRPRSRPPALAGADVYCSQSSSCRARLMATASDWGLWMQMS